MVFEDVHFSYRPGEEVLRSVSFEIPRGESLAVVGPTGAGKSTLVKLLTGLYPVDAGCIRVDGRDVRDWEPEALRRRVGVVLQDPFLFSRTLEENVALGAEELDARRLAAAAEAVGLAEIIERLPQGWATALGERGRTLSGGERQLVSFARTLAFDPGILVLDEATSQVDTRTEYQLKHATRALLEGRTTLVIAHRLATLEGVDRILVLSRGRVAEEGTHEALLAEQGIYSRLHALQSGGQPAPTLPSDV